jgi:hypothetical protein
MEIAAPDRLAQLLAEYERVSAAATANADNAAGGRGKQGKRRYDAALRRGAAFSKQLRQLENQIHAAGGEIPRDEPTPKPERPVFVGPVLPDHRAMTQIALKMTREALKAEDANLDEIRRAAKIWTLTPWHRAVKSALGEHAAADARARTAARRSDAAKRGAVTRARRKAAGLPPKHLEPFMPPPGGWTDADRVH